MKEAILFILFLGLMMLMRAQAPQSLMRGASGSITISPDTVCSNQLLSIDISGQNTEFTQGSSTYFYIESTSGHQIGPSNEYNYNDTNAVAYFNLIGASPGVYYFFGVDYLNDTIPSINNLVVNGPALLTVDTDKSYRGVTLDVTITGLCTNFQSATSTTAWLEKNGTDVYANSVTIVNSTQLIANISLPFSILVGYYNVIATDAIDNLMYIAQGFQVIDSAEAGIRAVNPDDVKVFPNPASGSLFIESAELVLSFISLIDMNGNLVYSKEWASQNEELPIGNLPPGLYILSVTDKSGYSIHKKVTVE